MRSGIDGVLRLGDLVGRRNLRGNGGVHLLTPLIEQFDGGETLRHEGAGAVEFLLGQRDLGLPLREVRSRLVEGALRQTHQRLGLL